MCAIDLMDEDVMFNMINDRQLCGESVLAMTWYLCRTQISMVKGNRHCQSSLENITSRDLQM
jgi:hypothetical protein